MSGFDPTIARLTSAEFTRPSNTTQYAAGDVVGPVTTPAVQTLLKASWVSGGGGEVVAIRLSKSDATVTLATFRVWFYKTAPTAIADNSAWTNLYADREKLIGYRDLDIAVSGGGAAIAQSAATMAPLPFVTAAGSSGSLYAVISCVGAYTPASAETFALSVTVKRYKS